MIDPINMTRYGLPAGELEETILFACCVAGKNAVTTARSLEKFLLAGHKIVFDGVWPLKGKRKKFRPFEMLRQLYAAMGVDGVASMLQVAGIGCFNNRARTFKELIDLNPNLKTASPAELEQVWGIAEKTSRFFILHTRPDVRYAALDTHIRKYMTKLGYEFPKGQPKGKRYLQLEQDFLKLADKSGMTVAEFDLYLWNMHAGHKAKREKKVA